MYLFNHPPRLVYAHMGHPKRENITIVPLKQNTSLAESFNMVSSSLGDWMQGDLLYFPPDYQGNYLLDELPNMYLYQVMGTCVAEGHQCKAGDMVRLTNPTILVQSSPSAPCVFARFVVSQPAQSFIFNQPHELSKMVMIEDYLQPELCEKIIVSMHSKKGDSKEYGRVLTNAKANNTTQNLDVRRAEVMYSEDKKLVDGTIEDVVVKLVEPFYASTMEFWNFPVLLRYEPGGFFVPHVDGEMFDPDTNTWSRIYDRDYTLVCFLNDEYTGGVLSFPEINFSVQPKQGRVVAFPGDHRFKHGAETTTAGTRYQLISWLTAFGTPRTNTPPNPAVIYRTW